MSTKVAVDIASTCCASNNKPRASNTGAIFSCTARNRAIAVKRPSAPPFAADIKLANPAAIWPISSRGMSVTIKMRVCAA